MPAPACAIVAASAAAPRGIRRRDVAVCVDHKVAVHLHVKADAIVEGDDGGVLSEHGERLRHRVMSGGGSFG